MKKTDNIPAQLLVSASKRNFKSAVDRNRIKRIVREAYRNNKSIIWDYMDNMQENQILISINYTAKTIVSYSEIERKLILILHSLIEKNE